MKILIAVLSCWFCFVVGAPVAFATDDVSEDVTEEITTNVSERVTCADIKSELNSLEINDENQARIDKLKSEYRRFCTPKAAKRRASDTSAIMYAKTAQAKAAPVVIDVEPEKVEVPDENADAEVTTETTAVATVTDVAPDEKKSDAVTDTANAADTPEPVDTRTPEEIQLEKELENLAAGLCADGTKPNKYGCCTDEIFKDLGDLVFACCPKDGGDCYEPITETVSER
ncbi:MAG: hypothetical protein IKL37_00895 [Alphaproteobacteria bacterium]|nr:hypothetical protein [Alphaproteobacteria bacterium]